MWPSVAHIGRSAFQRRPRRPDPPVGGGSEGASTVPFDSLAVPIRTEPHSIGRAWITPDGPVVAGSLGTWTITYEVGAYGYDERARIKIASRFASDWGRPQFSDPRGREYCTVRLESRCDTAGASLPDEPPGPGPPGVQGPGGP